MKILLAIHKSDRYYGIPKYYYLLANKLKNLEVSVKLVIDSDRLDIVRQYTDVEVVTLNPLAKDNLSTMRYCWNLSKYLQREDFDILHTCHILPYFYLMNKQHKPVVFQPFGNELYTLAGKGLNNLHCKLSQPILRYCGHNSDVLLAEGKFQWNDMVKWYDNESRMKILPVGIDISKFKRSIPYQSKIFHVLSVNSLTKYDNMELLIDAFKMFHKEVENSMLTIVGSGDQEDRLKMIATEGKFCDYIYFLKNVPESTLIDIYSMADVYVSTTLETDMQMGIIEAMASGLPIVSTGQGYMYSRNGIFSNTIDSPKALNEAIKLIYNGQRNQMSDNSIEAVKQYDFKVIAQQAVKIYESLLCKD